MYTLKESKGYKRKEGKIIQLNYYLKMGEVDTRRGKGIIGVKF
jgi:hypothetical protein